ncbi:hypothetical protein CBS101457_002836 [Exobasidium rhododendri]|nr:hypothetical protein CBS101457_002836 [Exobasidium rhododendri]
MLPLGFLALLIDLSILSQTGFAYPVPAPPKSPPQRFSHFDAEASSSQHRHSVDDVHYSTYHYGEASTSGDDVHYPVPYYGNVDLPSLPFSSHPSRLLAGEAHEGGAGQVMQNWWPPALHYDPPLPPHSNYPQPISASTSTSSYSGMPTDSTSRQESNLRVLTEQKLREIDKHLFLDDDDPPVNDYNDFDAHGTLMSEEHAPKYRNTVMGVRRLNYDAVGKVKGSYAPKLIHFGNLVFQLRGQYFANERSLTSSRSALLTKLSDEERRRLLASTEEEIFLLAKAYVASKHMRSNSWKNGLQKEQIAQLKEVLLKVKGTDHIVRSDHKILVALGDKKKEVLHHLSKENYSEEDAIRVFKKYACDTASEAKETTLNRHGKRTQARPLMRPKAITDFADRVLTIRGSRYKDNNSRCASKNKVIAALSQSQKDMIFEGSRRQEIEDLAQDFAFRARRGKITE